jgi:hypothetical protein
VPPSPQGEGFLRGSIKKFVHKFDKKYGKILCKSGEGKWKKALTAQGFSCYSDYEKLEIYVLCI